MSDSLVAKCQHLTVRISRSELLAKKLLSLPTIPTGTLKFRPAKPTLEFQRAMSGAWLDSFSLLELIQLYNFNVRMVHFGTSTRRGSFEAILSVNSLCYFVGVGLEVFTVFRQ